MPPRSGSPKFESKSPRSRSPERDLRELSNKNTSEKRISINLCEEVEQNNKNPKLDSPTGNYGKKQIEINRDIQYDFDVVMTEKSVVDSPETISSTSAIQTETANLQKIHEIINNVYNKVRVSSTEKEKLSDHLEAFAKILTRGNNKSEPYNKSALGNKELYDHLEAFARILTRGDNKSEPYEKSALENKERYDQSESFAKILTRGDNKPIYDRSLFLQGEVTKAEYRLRDYEKRVGKFDKNLDQITLEVDELVQWNGQDHINAAETSLASGHTEALDNAESMIIDTTENTITMLEGGVEATENTITGLKGHLNKLHEMQKRINYEARKVAKEIANIDICTPDHYCSLREDIASLADPDEKKKFEKTFKAQEEKWSSYDKKKTGLLEKVDASMRTTLKALKELQIVDLQQEVNRGDLKLEEVRTTLDTAAQELNESGPKVDQLVSQNLWDNVNQTYAPEDAITILDEGRLQELRQVEGRIKEQVDRLNSIEIWPTPYYEQLREKAAKIGHTQKEKFEKTFGEQEEKWSSYDKEKTELLEKVDAPLRTISQEMQNVELQQEIVRGDLKLEEVFTTIDTAVRALGESGPKVDQLASQNLLDNVRTYARENAMPILEAHQQELYRVRDSIQAQVNELNAIEIWPIPHYEDLRPKVAKIADPTQMEKIWNIFLSHNNYWQDYDQFRTNLRSEATRQLGNINIPITATERALQEANVGPNMNMDVDSIQLSETERALQEARDHQAE